MSEYGQFYFNPYATGTSPDAQNQKIAQALQLLKGGDQAGSQMDVSAIGGASLKNLGSPSGIAGISALAGAAGAGSSAAGSAGGLASAASGASGGFAGGLQTAGSAVGVLGGLANIYLGFKAASLAKKNYKFQVGAYNNNLENTVQTYNTSLEDRIRARHNTESRSASETNSYLDKNRLTANTLG